MTLKQKREELQAKQDALAKVFDEAKTDTGELDFTKVKSIDGSNTVQKVEKVRAMNAELDDIGKEVEALEEAEKARKGLEEPRRHQHADPDADPDRGEKQRYRNPSLGKAIADHAAFKAWQEGNKHMPMLVEGYGLKELKAAFVTTAGWDPETTRTGIMVDAATRPLQVIDVIPSGQTGQAAVVYMEETTRTHNAAEVAEAGAYAESAFALTERSEPVRKIGDSIPVSDEQLADVAMVQGYLDQRLRFGVSQRLDGQILNGTGVAPNLEGILNRTGLQTQAKGTDPIPDAIHKAMTKVRVTGRAIPGAVMLHSNDWQEIRLLRTSDGIYIWGSPSEAGPARIWGLPIVLTEALTEGTGLVGDFANFSQLFERRGVEVQMGFVNDQFTKGMQTMRADLRVALMVGRPAAFCEVTGI